MKKHSSERKAFISEIFLIIFLNCLNLSLLQISYLETYSRIMEGMEDYLEIFGREAVILERLKCHYLNEEEGTPEGDSRLVSINGKEYTYSLIFEGRTCTYTVEDRMITSFRFS
ncbi:MAG: hypothetical protein IIZ33_09690 [Erysipelotrichaceae bacterium]|nr:hypothetical protein [Erysipelotrichaceae bacterium]